MVNAKKLLKFCRKLNYQKILSMYGADYFDTTDLAVMHFGNAQTKIIEECTCTNTNFCFFLFKSFSDHVI